MHAQRSILLVAMAILACGPSGAQAESAASAPPPTVAALVQRLGRPVRPDPAREALRAAEAGGTAWACALAEALSEGGGVHALRALDGLSERPEPRLRLALIQAYERLDMRSRGALELLRGSLGTFARPAERRAAVRALGQLGDGCDVPRLVDLAFGEDAELRPVALVALQRLSGRATPAVEARWRAWARSLVARDEGALQTALDGLDAAPTERDALWARELRRLAWLDVAKVTATLGRWLADERAALVSLALELIGTLRLAELAPDLARLLRRNRDPEVRAEAEALLASFGYEGGDES